MTLDHLAISALKNAVHSSGELPIGVYAIAASLSLTSGAARPATIRRLSAAMMSLGVPAGATTAVQVEPSTSGNPASAMVGTSGKLGDRSLPVTASACRPPDLINGSAGGNEPN